MGLAASLEALRRTYDYMSPEDRVELEAALLTAAKISGRRPPTSLAAFLPDTSADDYVAAMRRTTEQLLAVQAEVDAQSLSTREVAGLLGVSPAAVTKRRAGGGLVAWRRRGDWRYPRWQFTDAGALLPGVVEAWRQVAVRHDIADVRWFLLPNRQLGGRPPIDALRAGDVDAVVDAASYVDSR